MAVAPNASAPDILNRVSNNQFLAGVEDATIEAALARHNSADPKHHRELWGQKISALGFKNIEKMEFPQGPNASAGNCHGFTRNMLETAEGTTGKIDLDSSREVADGHPFDKEKFKTSTVQPGSSIPHIRSYYDKKCQLQHSSYVDADGKELHTYPGLPVFTGKYPNNSDYVRYHTLK